MIKVEFKKNDSLLTEFTVTGHAGFDNNGKDIVCAFVSSACLMAANTVTDVMHIKADAICDEGYLKLQLKESFLSAQDILQGLYLHLSTLAQDYPKNIKVIITEV